MTVKSVKLLNNDEIIGDFADEVKDGNYLVTKLRVAILQPISDTQAQVMLAPWLYTNPEGKDIEIPVIQCVTVPGIPSEDMAKQYAQDVTPIQLLKS